MSRNVVIAVVAVLVIAGVVLGLVFGLRSSGPPSTIKLGVSLGLTGLIAAPSQQGLNGMEIAVKAINDAGGVYVKQYDKKLPLELIVLDDESNPTKAVTRFETLNERGVVAILGGMGSFIAPAIAPIAEKNKTPFIGTAASIMDIHTKGYTYLFEVFNKTNDQAKVIMDLLDSVPDGQRPTKIAIFTINTTGGKELTAAWQQLVGARQATKGYQIVYESSYELSTTDFVPMVTAAKAAGADVLFSFPVTPQGIAMMRAAKDLAWDLKVAYLIRAAEGVAFGGPEALGADAEYVTSNVGYHYTVPFTGNDALNTAYQALYGRPSDPLTGSGYALVQVAADAIERAGTLDRKDIRDALTTTDMMTVIGPVTFNADGSSPVIGIIPQWQGGQQVLVWPKEFGGVTIPTSEFKLAPPWSSR